VALQSEGKFSTAISAAKAAVTGGVAAPGKLIILNESEVCAAGRPDVDMH
jgi:hypothetical protein